MAVPLYQLINNYIMYSDLEKLIEVFDSLPDSKWQDGRQGTGYKKYEITKHYDEWYHKRYVVNALNYLGYSKAAQDLDGGRWDAWLMKMPDGAYIHPHTDPCPFDAGSHHRFNMCVRPAERGGHFSIEGEHVPVHTGEAIIFRPDAMRHEVSMVSGRDRLMISVGCVKETR